MGSAPIDVQWVPGTIRRWTIRRGQFGAKYNINFIENPINQQ